MNKLKEIFKKEKGVVIGAIHFPPLLGYQDFPGFDTAIKNTLEDLQSFESGGVDGVIVENNYDTPHKVEVGPEIVASMTYLTEKIKSVAKVPIGISVLWNDYKTALSIAKVLKLQFIRLPVFVDIVKTNYGTVEGNPEEVLVFRKHIGAEDVAIFTDIHVKHSQIISKHSVIESVNLAIEQGADALIVTGNWTGDAPNIDELKKIREKIQNFPILCGSGVNAENIKTLFKYANGAIVSTSLKEGKVDSKEINIKPYSHRIDRQKVEILLAKVRQ